MFLGPWLELLKHFPSCHCSNPWLNWFGLVGHVWGSLDLCSLLQINLQVIKLKSPEDRAGGIFCVDVSGCQGFTSIQVVAAVPVPLSLWSPSGVSLPRGRGSTVPVRP